MYDGGICTIRFREDVNMDAINICSKLYDYSVKFVDNFETELSELDGELAYVIDKNIYDLYANRFSRIDKSRIYLMDPVEDKKNLDTVIEIIKYWRELGVQKNWRIICFGGGITQDVTTISSNLYLRNMDWYFFPTTLLAMCDSCIGGKCGINFGEYKNQLGVFYPPKKIIIDVSFLSTLSQADYLNGWGELLKFSLTSDVNFYERVKNEKEYIPCKQIADYIYSGLMIKKNIIEEDEFESDLRRVLNYGHTFGHALEAYSKHEIPHGKAVIWGIDVINYFSWREGLIDERLYLDVKALIKQAFLKEEVVVSNPEKLFEIIRTDKKVRANILSFAVLDGPSHLIVYPMPIDERLKGMFLDYVEQTHMYYCN